MSIRVDGDPRRSGTGAFRRAGAEDRVVIRRLLAYVLLACALALAAVVLSPLVVDAARFEATR